MATLENFNKLMQGFGIVTVMNIHIYELKEVNGKRSYLNRDKALTAADFEYKGEYLDTLKIANLTQEGPTKTITGGQYANPLIKYGKTMTCEMQDALGRADTLTRFFGCEYDETTGRVSVGDKFPGAFAIEGETFFINQATGDKETVYILIPQFTPDSILSLTQDAEGDATVFDLNGGVSVTSIADNAEDAGTGVKENSSYRNVFYEIRSTEWFQTIREAYEAEQAQ